MAKWTPAPEWEGETVFIIGGGPSLKGFDWSKLHGKRTIGCNTAFTLGARVCSLCFFSDVGWWETFRTALSGYAGRIVTHCPELLPPGLAPGWLLQVEREDFGLHKHAVGYNGNSGASAVNLALLMGAKRVVLLGVDNKAADARQTHWHDKQIEEHNPQVYDKFSEGWRCVAMDLPVKFPGCEIINASENSNLTFFPKVPLSKIL